MSKNDLKNHHVIYGLYLFTCANSKYPLFSQKSLYTQFLIRTDEHTLSYTKVYSAM